MNRVELIARIAGRSVAGGYTAKGLSVAAGAQAITKPKLRPYTRKGRETGSGNPRCRMTSGLTHHCTAIERDIQGAKKACFKAPERRGVHHLTRIATRLKRVWHG